MKRIRIFVLIVAIAIVVVIVALVLNNAATRRARAATFAPLSTVQLPAVERFVAAENFKLDAETGPRFSRSQALESTFEERFLTKTETGIGATTLTAYKLLPSHTNDDRIRKLLGKKAEVSLAHLFELLKHQPNGENGILATDERGNLFHIRGNDGELYVLTVILSTDGWDISPIPVVFPHGYGDGWLVFSR